MPNFKVGQRVRRSHRGLLELPIGTIGTVVFVYGDGDINVNINGEIWRGLWREYFELVDPAPTKEERWVISKNRVETRHLRKKNGQ